MPSNANTVLNVLKGAEGQMPVFTDFRTTLLALTGLQLLEETAMGRARNL